MSTIKKISLTIIILLGIAFCALIFWSIYRHQTVAVLPTADETTSVFLPNTLITPNVELAATSSATSHSLPALAKDTVKDTSEGLHFNTTPPTTSITPQSLTESQTQHQNNASAEVVITPTPAFTPVPTTAPSPAIQKIHVTVSIDGGAPFSLAIEQGKNHCEVLSQALQEGQLRSLNMQYNSAFSSYAVYEINGLGREGQVWWTYLVNDKSPPMGCSHSIVENNDRVQWQYVGPR